MNITNCFTCNKLFKPKRSTAKYCCDTCRVYANRNVSVTNEGVTLNSGVHPDHIDLLIDLIDYRNISVTDTQDDISVTNLSVTDNSFNHNELSLMIQRAIDKKGADYVYDRLYGIVNSIILIE